MSKIRIASAVIETPHFMAQLDASETGELKMIRLECFLEKEGATADTFDELRSELYDLQFKAQGMM